VNHPAPGLDEQCHAFHVQREIGPGQWEWVEEGVELMDHFFQWIGLRENLQETMVFTKYRS